jgi:hypothetical protein
MNTDNLNKPIGYNDGWMNTETDSTLKTKRAPRPKKTLEK